MLSVVKWILLGLLLFLTVLLLIPVRTRVRYDGKLTLWCGIGPLSLKLFPLKKKKSKKTKKQKKSRKAPASKASKPPKPKEKLTLEAIIEYIRFGTRALKKMLRRLVLSNLTCHLIAAGEDAAKAALLYGRVSAGVSMAYPLLEDGFRIRKSDILIDLDFEKKKPELLIDTTVSACPLRLLAAAVLLLIQFLKLRKNMQQTTQTTVQEGGIYNEQHQRRNESNHGEAAGND